MWKGEWLVTRSYPGRGHTVMLIVTTGYSLFPQNFRGVYTMDVFFSSSSFPVRDYGCLVTMLGYVGRSDAASVATSSAATRQCPSKTTSCWKNSSQY